MAHVQSPDGFAIDLSDVDLLELSSQKIADAKDSAIRVVISKDTQTIDSIKYELIGYIDYDGDFVFGSGDDLIDGTLTGIDVATDVRVLGSTSTTKFLTIDDFDLPVSRFIDYVASDDTKALLADILSGADTIAGTGERDVLLGYGGNDHISGGGGRDKIFGGGGNDTLIGGSGGDRLRGDGGADRIDVSKGHDKVIYRKPSDAGDVIDGFDGNPANGQDVIELEALFDRLGFSESERAAGEGFTIIDGRTLAIDADNDDLTGGNGGFEIVLATINVTSGTFDSGDVFV